MSVGPSAGLSAKLKVGKSGVLRLCLGVGRGDVGCGQRSDSVTHTSASLFALLA